MDSKEKKFNKDNFWKRSVANWTEIDEKIVPEKPNFTSTTGDGETPSAYYFLEKGVIRKADHWGQVQNCIWLLNGKAVKNSLKIAFCRWDDFSWNEIPEE